jgi:hypothetical protein
LTSDVFYLLVFEPPLFQLDGTVLAVLDPGRPVFAMPLAVEPPRFPLDGAVWSILDMSRPVFSMQIVV